MTTRCGKTKELQTKNVVIFNDTSYEGHVGCIGVICELKEVLRRMNVVPVALFSMNQVKNAYNFCVENNISHIIINGEGTFHHDRRDPLKWLKLASKIKATTQCRIAIVNSSWFSNKKLNNYLEFVDFFVARDTASFQNVQPYIHPDRLLFCPDLFLFFVARYFSENKNYNSNSEVPRQVIVTDSVSYKQSAKLISLCRSLNGEPMSMIKREKGFEKINGSIRRLNKKKLLDLYYIYIVAYCWMFFKKPISIGEFLEKIDSCDVLCTGRYHAVIAALALGKQIIPLESNTPKISSTLLDHGISGPPEESVPNTSWETCPKRLDKFVITPRNDILDSARCEYRKFSAALKNFISL